MSRPVERILLAATVLSLAACGSDRPVSQMQPTHRPPPREAEVSSPETETPAEPEYVYSPVGKRDPFRSPLSDGDGSGRPGEEAERELTPLQRWNLEQLQVQAIISGTSTPMAMVVDPDGTGHVVRRGTLMGKNWGKVSAIRRDCLVITEQRRDATGAVVQVRQERCLPRDEREDELLKQLR